MPTLPPEHEELLAVVAAFVDEEVAPQAAAREAAEEFPRATFDRLAALGVTGLAFPADVGGGDVGDLTYLRVLETLARGHATLALALSVHTLAASAVERFATPEQRKRFLPGMVAGDHLGAYCLSEPDAGSDAAALRCRAILQADGSYRVTGTKAWVTHAGVADRYLLFARTGEGGARGISAFVLDADQPGMTIAALEDKMGLRGSPTAEVSFDEAAVAGDRLLGGEEGRGFEIAMAALDGGRLGVAAVATGLAQAALDAAVAYARQRQQFGRAVVEFQGVGFLLADMATQLEAARTLYRDAAARRDAGEAVSQRCSMAKLFCTDTAMRVTTDAVQVHGGVGYTRDFPVERYLREAKVMQIFEGTNQIQRLVISRHLARGT